MGAAGRFDAFRLAARGETRAGELDLAQDARVADRLAPNAGPAKVAWTIEGGCDPLGRPMLTVTLRGRLAVICQRCLRSFDVRLNQRSELLLAHDEPELARLDAEEREVVLAAAPLDAMALIEDELLLSLPYAPMHADSQCAAAAPEGMRQEHRASSTFAELAAIRKARGKTSEE
ncbi:MAG TPA: YceD family protein [Casimicrobiaceae bacterium]|nr:YceD family protein [Casimicrobiaceae bacterium]